jgi:hypothetical protein
VCIEGEGKMVVREREIVEKGERDAGGREGGRYGWREREPEIQRERC